jgi:hypothetical protein
LLTSTNNFNQQRFRADGILFPYLHKAVYVNCKPKTSLRRCINLCGLTTFGFENFSFRKCSFHLGLVQQHLIYFRFQVDSLADCVFDFFSAFQSVGVS